MYLAPDDAKSDVILAGAVIVFGGAARSFVVSLPLYPRDGVVGVLLELVWFVVLTSLVPVLLARYRGDGADAFGLHGLAGIGAGVLLAVPVVALGLLNGVLNGLPPLTALLGRLGIGISDAFDAAIQLAAVALLSIGALLLVGFLATRSRDGFPRSPETSPTELVRTLGLGAVGVALVLGLLRGFGPGDPVAAVLHVAALAAVLLLADRWVPSEGRMPRATVLVPVVVVVVAQLFAAGGLFRGDLLSGLYLGALAAGTTIAIAALSQTRAGLAAATLLAVAVHWWPTCLSPLPLATGIC